MNREETVKLTRYIKAVCPQQAIDDFTPNAWHDLLGDVAYPDALAAVQIITGRKPFVAPAEIRDEVRRIRTSRLEGFQYVPVEGDDDHRIYLAAYRAQRTAVADGHREAAPALPAGPDRSAERDALLADLFPKPPATDKPRELQRAETPEETRERLLSEAYAYLITINDDARTKAIEAAHTQLGADAERADVVTLAAQLTDARPQPARPDKALADKAAADGCPFGCPLGTHTPACYFADAS